MLEQASNVIPQLRGGTIRAYAVTAKTRLASAPDVPPALVSVPASARPAAPVNAVVVPDAPSDEQAPQAPQAPIETKLTNRKPTLTCIDIP